MECHRKVWFVILAMMGAILELALPAGSVSISNAQDQAATAAAAEIEAAVNDASNAVATDRQIDQWLQMLGSDKFAIRERAATKLIGVGDSVVPRLQRLARSATDPETRLRAGELVKQITRGDQEARIESFLAGASDDLDGWAMARLLLDDTGATRELYVELFRAHPEIAASLVGRQIDRAIAMNTVAARVRKARIEEGRFETRADAVALLLPLAFDREQISSEYELLLIRTLTGTAGTKLHKNPNLNAAYRGLVGRWARRSGMNNRQELLWLMMQHDVTHALTLAIDTLARTDDCETVSIALQAIARFGDQRVADSIMTLLHDDRSVVDNGFVRGKPSRTELGDVAMATVAILYKIPLAEVGFVGATIDPKIGFRPEEVGFAMGDQKQRSDARQKLIAKVREKKLAEKGQQPEPLLVE